MDSASQVVFVLLLAISVVLPTSKNPHDRKPCGSHYEPQVAFARKQVSDDVWRGASFSRQRMEGTHADDTARNSCWLRPDGNGRCFQPLAAGFLISTAKAELDLNDYRMFSSGLDSIASAIQSIRACRN